MITVIAYGNPLCGDAAAAWRVADRLEGSGEIAAVLTLVRLTSEVAMVVSQADGVVFVEAAHGSTPGHVSVRDVDPCATQVADTRHMRPETVLAIAQQLHGFCPRAALVSIDGESFTASAGLSAAARHAVDEAARIVRRLIREWSLGTVPEGTTLGPSRVPHA